MSVMKIFIGVCKKGSYSVIYCHWDGYPSGVGQILATNYNTTEKVKSLLELGDLSSLGERLNPDKGEIHSFDNPLDDVTVAYHRDRGEPLKKAMVFESLEELLEEFKDSWCDYLYIFDSVTEEWSFCKDSKGLFEQLAEALGKEVT